MTQQDPRNDRETQDNRRARLERLIEEGREAELDEDEYQFAIENGLIEG